MATYQVVAKTGPTAGNVYALDKTEMFIGRDINNDIVINDPEVSRRHARLFLQGKTYVLEDLGSTNGTVVKGQRLMGPYVLKDGDEITLGETVNLSYEIIREMEEEEATRVMQGGESTMKIPQGEVEFFMPSQAPEPVAFEGQSYITPEKQPQYQQPAYAGNVPGQPRGGEEEKKKFPTIMVLAVILILLVICVCVVGAYFAPSDLWCTVDIFGFFGDACP
jgi:pSer/pThr/pTyr-binding forkhead associated (FHA) protein